MKILLWHVHGAWTDAFVRGGHEYILPATPAGAPWGLGRGGRDWPAAAREVAPDALREQEIDVVVLQRPEELAECERLLGRRPGRDVPAVFLEHNTPKGNVPASLHPLADQREIPIVHVTHFNSLMWDAGTARSTVIEHGVVDPGPLYTGERPSLGAVINEPVRRWRVTGTDLLADFARAAPLEVFGMKTAQLGAALKLDPDRLHPHGDVPTAQLHQRLAGCRAYVHPARWTSLGLSLLEAMHLGMPVLVLASTEASRAVPPEAGAVSTSVAELCRAAAELIADPQLARQRGAVAREAALQRYGLQKFLQAWDEVLGNERAGAARHEPAYTAQQGRLR